MKFPNWSVSNGRFTIDWCSCRIPDPINTPVIGGSSEGNRFIIAFELKWTKVSGFLLSVQSNSMICCSMLLIGCFVGHFCEPLDSFEQPSSTFIQVEFKTTRQIKVQAQDSAGSIILPLVAQSYTMVFIRVHIELPCDSVVKASPLTPIDANLL